MKIKSFASAALALCICMLALSSCGGDNLRNINDISSVEVSSEMPAFAGEPEPAPDESSDTDSAASEETVSRTPEELAADLRGLINSERKTRGIVECTFTDELNASAAVRAEELKTKYSHTRPDGTECVTAITKSYLSAGELIAKDYKSAQSVYFYWMGEDSRRSVLFNEGGYGFDTAGVAVSVGEDGTYYWVVCAIQAMTSIAPGAFTQDDSSAAG